MIDGRAASNERRPAKVSEYVAQRILGDIVGEGLQPGDRLEPAAEMLERYQVGVASLREALRLLEVAGLIYIKTGPGGGPIVAQRSGADLAPTMRMYFQIMGVTFRDLVTARQRLEPLLAREAAESSEPELREQLLELAQRGAGDDRREFQHVAREFHDVLATATHANPIVGLFVRSVGQVYKEFVRTRGPRTADAHRPDAVAEHQAIAQAIAAGDGDAAEALMAAHMAGLTDYLSEEYAVALDDVIEWT